MHTLFSLCTIDQYEIPNSDQHHDQQWGTQGHSQKCLCHAPSSTHLVHHLTDYTANLLWLSCVTSIYRMSSSSAPSGIECVASRGYTVCVTGHPAQAL